MNYLSLKVYTHDQASGSVSVSVAMKMEQLLKQALWLSFWEPKEAPTIQWRIAAYKPTEARRPNFTLKQSTDCEMLR